MFWIFLWIFSSFCRIPSSETELKFSLHFLLYSLIFFAINSFFFAKFSITFDVGVEQFSQIELIVSDLISLEINNKILLNSAFGLLIRFLISILKEKMGSKFEIEILVNKVIN